MLHKKINCMTAPKINIKKYKFKLNFYISSRIKKNPARLLKTHTKKKTSLCIEYHLSIIKLDLKLLWSDMKSDTQEVGFHYCSIRKVIHHESFSIFRMVETHSSPHRVWWWRWWQQKLGVQMEQLSSFPGFSRADYLDESGGDASKLLLFLYPSTYPTFVLASKPLSLYFFKLTSFRLGDSPQQVSSLKHPIREGPKTDSDIRRPISFSYSFSQFPSPRWLSDGWHIVWGAYSAASSSSSALSRMIASWWKANRACMWIQHVQNYSLSSISHTCARDPACCSRAYALNAVFVLRPPELVFMTVCE